MKSTRWLLKLLGLLFVATLVLSAASCNLFGGGTLTIRNYSSTDIDFVRWNGYAFGDDWLYDAFLGYNVWGIAAAGGVDAQDVDLGSDYIYFYFADDITAQKYRTTESVDVGLFADGNFTFYDSTWVVTATLRDGSTETRVYGIEPIPGNKREE